MRTRCSLLILGILAPPALAQTIRVVSGTVRDSAGAPIAGAIVAVVDINETAYHATTNAQGRFTLRYQAVDTARFVVSHLQYVRFWRRLDSVAIAGERSDIDVRLGISRGQRWGPSASERPLDIHDDTIPDTELEDVARAAGLSLLRERRRTGGDAEIRLAIDSLGVWTLPDENELPRFVFSLDGFVLTAEMFDGTHYRLIRHANPDPASSPEAERAAQIARLVGSVMGEAVGNKKP